MTLAALLTTADPAELRNRLQTLRMTARLLTGPRARAAERALADAERDPNKLARALQAIDELPLPERRPLLSSLARTL